VVDLLLMAHTEPAFSETSRSPKKLGMLG